MNTTTLVKWGNGQGVRLAKAVTEEAGFHAGDELEVRVSNGTVTLTPTHRRIVTIPDFESMFANYQGSAPSEDGFAAKAGREAW